VAVALTAGPRILTLLYGPEYAEHNDILVWVMVAGAIGYAASVGNSAINAARRFRIQIPLYAAAVGALTLSCLWLVPAGGLLGAALSLSVAALVQLIGGVLVITHALRAGPRLPQVLGSAPQCS
jgi:O-antigen/teichoic acid export membrane protein